MNEAAFLILFLLDTCSHLSLAWTLRLTLCCGSQPSRVRGSSQEGVRLGRKAQRKLVPALNRMKEMWLYRGAGNGKKSWTTLGCDLYSLCNQQILVMTGQCLSMCSILWSEVREKEELQRIKVEILFSLYQVTSLFYFQWIFFSLFMSLGVSLDMAVQFFVWHQVTSVICWCFCLYCTSIGCMIDNHILCFQPEVKPICSRVSEHTGRPYCPVLLRKALCSRE